MKISVVTISYNQARFLPACIDSVAAQDAPYEHIIVDPGSTDGSREIIAANRKHFSHILLERDDGPADGLNRGFSKATGDIYYYLNSDDVVRPGAFSAALNLFNEKSHVDVISGGGYIIDEEGRRKRKLWSDTVTQIGLAHGGSIIIQPSTFIRKEIFVKVGGFNVANRSNWDGELVIDMYEAGGKFATVNQFWSGYRVHQESMTGTAKTDDLIADWNRRMYKRIMGSEPSFYSTAIVQYFQLRRVLRHPEIIVSRISGGPIYGGQKP